MEALLPKKHCQRNIVAKETLRRLVLLALHSNMKANLGNKAGNLLMVVRVQLQVVQQVVSIAGLHQGGVFLKHKKKLLMAMSCSKCQRPRAAHVLINGTYCSLHCHVMFAIWLELTKKYILGSTLQELQFAVIQT